jgi:uncharacterized protein (UPF0276 family)
MVEYVAKRGPVKAVLLERDGDFPPFSEILDELAIARRLLTSARQSPVPSMAHAATP